MLGRACQKLGATVIRPRYCGLPVSTPLSSDAAASSPLGAQQPLGSTTIRGHQRWLRPHRLAAAALAQEGVYSLLEGLTTSGSSCGAASSSSGLGETRGGTWGILLSYGSAAKLPNVEFSGRGPASTPCLETTFVAPGSAATSGSALCSLIVFAHQHGWFP